MSTDALHDYTNGPTSAGDIPSGHPSRPVDDVEPVDDVSDLDLLGRDLAEKVTAEVTTLPVPTRNGYSVRYSTDIGQGELDAWRKRSKDKRRTDGVASERFAALILANKATAIVRAGRELTEDGEPLTFRSSEVLALVHAQSAADAVAKFYGGDAYVDQAARSLLSEAGWGDDVLTDEGPTGAGRS